MSPLSRLDAAIRRTALLTHDRPPTGRTHDDADDDVGTIATDGAQGFDPFPLLRALHRAGAPVVVMGQVAGILHGSVELTGDLDLLWDGRPERASAMAAGFAAVGAELADDSGAPVACVAEAFLLPKVLFSAVGVSGDCCTPALPWGDVPIAAFLDRCQRVVADDGVEIRYLSRADLIVARRATGRPKDRRRADELERLGG